MTSINLLPQIQKRAVYRRYRGRLLTVAAILFILFATLSTLFTLPALFLGEVNIRAAGERLAIAREATERAEKALVTEQSRAAKKKTGLLRGEERVLLTHTEIVKAVIGKQEKGVVIEEFFYREEPKKPKGITQTLVVRGVSENRASLLSFSEGLQGLSFVGKVALPVEQLAKSVDIPFSITLTYRLGEEQMLGE
ncbi:MAG: hypothetical protein HY455_00215 [Parcubacteria group bacterium]|nr:hypothetical protein [Parcubacteria group bacterium]